MNEKRLERIRLDLAIARDNMLTGEELAAVAAATPSPSWPAAD